MASERNEGAEQATSSTPAIGLTGMIQKQYKKIKEHAEAYPYVWGSYITVYGGFGLYLAYRWRKLRQREDNIRILQKRLRELVQAEEAAESSAVTAQEKPSPPAVTAQKKPSSPAVESNATK